MLEIETAAQQHPTLKAPITKPGKYSRPFYHIQTSRFHESKRMMAIKETIKLNNWSKMQQNKDDLTPRSNFPSLSSKLSCEMNCCKNVRIFGIR
ncbi:hypothetical protein AVEN_111614-1 [Araneus ventricosus]|uniref:Uncharacterized protein n=1 Tax=Araneus ventricosus TaxID=182803 RepID=A0A4Y2C1Z3_ARAVE|nr:hypothetical protein AVEN_111614-1 [Araneus ventricosus]